MSVSELKVPAVGGRSHVAGGQKRTIRTRSIPTVLRNVPDAGSRLTWRLSERGSLIKLRFDPRVRKARNHEFIASIGQ